MRAVTIPSRSVALPAVALAAALLAGYPAVADDESAFAGDVDVENIAATPARAGETTRLTFTIRNGGSDRVQVTGVQFPHGEPSRVVGFLGGSHSATVGALSIAPGEEVQLGARRAWLEVGPLRQDLAAGSRVVARLVLGRGTLPLTVHVGTAAPARQGT